MSLISFVASEPRPVIQLQQNNFVNNITQKTINIIILLLIFCIQKMCCEALDIHWELIRRSFVDILLEFFYAKDNRIMIE
jgi:small-conductance mechanosensitive channel